MIFIPLLISEKSDCLVLEFGDLFNTVMDGQTKFGSEERRIDYWPSVIQMKNAVRIFCKPSSMIVISRIRHSGSAHPSLCSGCHGFNYRFHHFNQSFDARV
jgi:hypothetical protein